MRATQHPIQNTCFLARNTWSTTWFISCSSGKVKNKTDLGINRFIKWICSL